MTLELTVVFTPDENGTWIAEILELDGAFSYGNTKEHALEMALEVAGMIMADQRKKAEAELEPTSGQTRERLVLAPASVALAA